VSIHIALNHRTHYRYERPVSLGPQIVRLRPAPHSRTPILSYALKITPAGHFINWQQDPQANWLARLVFPEKTQEFTVEVDLLADMAVINPFDFFPEPYAEHIPFAYEDWQRHELTPYLYLGPETPLFADYLASIPRDKKRSVDFLVDLNRRLSRDIAYLIRLEAGVQTPEETLRKGTGSCRDTAWLLVQLLRHLGLAARFVSGYLIQLTADVKSLDGPSGPAADFTDLHAWCEVYLPGAGWIGLDPTSGMFAGEGHIPLACTPEPSSAAPVSGMVEAAQCDFAHHMSVARIDETPRVTKPYSEAQWQAIDALGRRIDAELAAGDVRLTMGGEPTFVAVDDPDGAEWNTTALGPTKRLLAADLLQRLRQHYAPQGLLHFGQGKWYPGEPLPRWSLNCFWRKDGQPIWQEAALLADERQPLTIDWPAQVDLAGRLLQGVAERLGIAAEHVFPAFEDIFYYQWRQRRLPINVDASDSRQEDALERARLRRLFEQGLPNAVGHVLPVHREAQGGWRSSSWFLRVEQCLLLPGDSPLGYRLPIDAQPWVAAADYPYINPPDPAHPDFLQRVPLPDAADIRKKVAHRQAKLKFEPGPAPAVGSSAKDICRQALCVEPRNGLLYVFMPPTEAAAHYLELLAAVEATAAELAVPVILEGYEPPADPRLGHFRVTPDPGVIEVNIHPAATWDELAERTTHLYEAARTCRLATEKFMIDGRHTGTGGGNHFVLGAASVADSPFLRRPDLLRSLISYWHNHPSLSYLFSGLFIGPTSQAPRLDEARNDAVYEIETAFREMARRSEPGRETLAPWLIDRLLRNLLVDISGNTHRTEFCIDKLFSPDGPTGRLGLLEMRAFEMPPHARMSLAQQLLLRGLVARFWKTPYVPDRLVRWGTELHDRFLLPHFVRQDFNEVLAEMGAAGFAIEPAWFDPHFEFRFPRHGSFCVNGIDVEVRHALEPWHVLGEEGGGAVRYVDSSLERLQIKVSGMAAERYVLTCNGQALPLQPTGTVGEFIAGVRYRAWQPASCLHPTIPVQAPLIFDLVDTWMERSLGGCQYHVTHPGGRNYDSFPVNASEAESRRLARFFTIGHTPGRMKIAPPAVAAEFPFTLDLRQR
jgi:uncharacterized protein (DUF2126 family)